MLKLVVQKLHKRYCPGSLDGQDNEVPRTVVDIRSANKCHSLLVKCTYLDPRFQDALTENDIISARSQLIEEFFEQPVGTAFENGNYPICSK